MNIYFSCSITGGRQDQQVYHAIVERLHALGHQVPTAHLASPDILSLEAVASPEEVYARDVAWVTGCDALVAEVSTPSHGVGYEIALANFLGKPVLCCHRQGARVSKMISGNTNSLQQVRMYHTTGEAVLLVETFLSQLERKS